MKTYIIKLNGEELELAPTFENMAKVEKLVGNVYELAGKIAESKLGLTDVVNIYHQMQHESADNQDVILEGVLEDGLSSHMEQIVIMLASIFAGSKKSKSVKK